MIKQYFIQAFHLLKENKLISFISIAGTSMAIAMIMVIVLTLRVETANYLPENKRDRTLYVKWMSTYWNDNPNSSSNGPMAVQTAKECFKDLTTPEAVSILTIPDNHLASSPEGEQISVILQQTDESFWEVFDFSFLNGKPFDLADTESGLAKAVITETVARKLFNTVDATGRTMSLDYANYTVVGVVKDVSSLARTAFAEVWIPYTSTDIGSFVWNQVMGVMRVVILAHSSADFPAIREEVEKLRLKFNDQLKDQKIMYRDQPDTQFVYNNRKWANIPPDMDRIVIQYIIIIALLLMVPAINLSGMTLSRMRKRFPEIGVRKAFGASKNELLWQILTENFLLTLIGGIVGLLITYGASYLLKDLLFDHAVLSLSMLLDPLIFVMAFLFCLVLNLLSAGIPAWRAARMNIISALTS